MGSEPFGFCAPVGPWGPGRGESAVTRRSSAKLTRMQCAQINDITGVIMLGRSRMLSLYTLNGDLILEQDVCAEGDDAVISCAFYEGFGNEYLDRDLIFTGQKKGVANVSCAKKSLKDGSSDCGADLEQSDSGWRLRSGTCETHASSRFSRI